MTALDRARLNVPEVHRLLAACDRMLDNWAETDPHSAERGRLWADVHVGAAALTERAYGGPTLRTRAAYWLRPYDARLDARVWRWRRPGPCRVIDLTHTTR
jgi:hypothetical protein